MNKGDKYRKKGYINYPYLIINNVYGNDVFYTKYIGLNDYSSGNVNKQAILNWGILVKRVIKY